MPIVSSKVLRRINRVQGFTVHESHVDHLGNTHDYRYRATNIGQDDSALLSSHALEVEARYIEGEAIRVYGECLEGVNPATITTQYLTDAERVRACFRAFVTGELEEIAHMLDWVKAFTTQDFNSLGFTAEERGQVNAREGSVEGAKALYEADLLFKLEDF